ncbi:hypothetical protein Mgra_00007368 [Meloidogyne graminicola]|uniref:Headcase N-terminal domain-containing protein n=1 Tax=Meloidogyne graminicola TaxID=189291 RepID=A0A8S9ZJ15_9BILA|nr:hypothetical protein Mgra_00007368 [Meloidogyne graminicola]
MTTKNRRSATKGFEPEEFDENLDCPVPYIACVCRGVQIPRKITDENAGFRMRCTNDRCHLANKLEENLLKILGNEGSARGWTETQLRMNLWEKKGQSLIGRILRCRCGMGVMSVDVDFYKKQMDEERKQKTFVDPKVLQAKKAAKKSKLPAINYNGVRPVPVELLQNDFIPTNEPKLFDENLDCPVPYTTCVCRGIPIPRKITDENAGFRMRCTNDRCHLANKLEENLLKILGNEGSARGWTETQLRMNLWEKKGQSLIGRILRCRCGIGVMSVDVDFYKKQMDEERKQKTFVDPKVLQAKKAAKKSKLPVTKNNVNQNLFDENLDCPVPYIACVCRGVQIPRKITDENAGFRMRCTNDRCHLARSARGWTETQLRMNLWEKKGQSLIGRILRCRCGMGVMSVDVDFYKPRRFYSLFDPDSRGFYLGEQILGNFYLPRLLQPSITI